MAAPKIVLAGGTGFTGKYLARKYAQAGYTVHIIARSPGCIAWHDTAKIDEAINGAALLINLAGKSVDCRYNAKNKKAIYDSRIDTTRILGEAVLRSKNPPPVWMNSSTATIYRHAEDRPMTESTGEIGTGFSVGIATSWEKTFFDFKTPATRQVALRMAIVLGKDGGVMKPLTNLVRFGLGGHQGSGKQLFSWIHIEDLARIITFLHEHPEITGAVNCAAPGPVTNKAMMQALRNTLRVGFGLPSPRLLLEIGAVFIRTETELVLKSRWVLPERLEQAGFTFTYPKIENAFEEIIRG